MLLEQKMTKQTELKDESKVSIFFYEHLGGNLLKNHWNLYTFKTNNYLKSPNLSNLL